MGCASESSTASAPDCSTVCGVPSRSGRSPVVHVASAAHISPAPSPRSLPMRRSVVVLTLLSVPAIVVGQGFRLTVESIMRGPDLVGTAPSNVRFSADGRYVYFAWRSPGVDTLDRDYRVAVAGAASPERLPRNTVDTIAMADGAWSPDLRREVVVLKGDVWLVERTGAKRRLTQTPAPESDPAWSADGRTVYFTRDGNAWALGLEDGALRQLSDIRRGPAPKKPSDPTGEKKFLRDQQRELFDFIRRQVAEEQMRADTDTVHTAKPLYLAERQTAPRLDVAPDARFVLVTVTERAKGDSLEGRQDGETVYYGSEETGYAHLYTVPAAGGAPRALTRGAWEVQQVALAPDGKTFYLHTNEGDFAQVHYYALDVASGRKIQLTSAEGRQDAVVSPDGKLLAVLHSRANHPPELYFQADQPGSPMRNVTESTTSEWRSGGWISPEIVMIPARDGARVPGRLYRPTATPANHAAVLFVHGAGYLQNVHKWWSSYYREYMFNQLLASKGYAVLDLDYRGSAGQGRDWRTAIYRHMGGKDLDDQVDGARWLVQHLGVDSTKIGIYGGSYGGFITLMAMFTQPHVFAAGAALRPVTDWAHYNHPYTARILNEPQDDSVAYRQSSPIYFAEGLQGRLLICHGMVDDNVHFQDTARLTQRLIELKKENWDVALYPVERHGFTRNDSWTDEYRRILKLFEETLGGGR